MEIHKSKCPNFSNAIQISVDGVSECLSNVNSIDVYSTRFDCCRTIYPIQIIRPIGKYRVDNQHFLDEFLTDCCINNCIIEAFIGDNPVRSNARYCKAHSSYYPCEYCESKGHILNILDRALTQKKKVLQDQMKVLKSQISIAEENQQVEQVESLKNILKTVTESIKTINRKHNNIVWPSSTRNGTPRTIEKVRITVQKIENDDILGQDETKGIVGHSLFLDILYFDFILDIPVEYLHGVCLGVVKRMIVLTFDVGENRQRNTTRKLSLASDYNEKMSGIKVHRECSRRARNLDFSVMKGQEFRNIIIFLFPIVIDCIEKPAKERRLWLLLAYLIRICVLPDIEFNSIDDNQAIIEYCGSHF